MPKIEKFVCDRCGVERDRDVGMVTVVIAQYQGWQSQWMRANPGKPSICHDRLWCVSCVKETGLPKVRDYPPEPAGEPPTFEGVLRELIRDVVQESQS